MQILLHLTNFPSDSENVPYRRQKLRKAAFTNYTFVTCSDTS